mgnify:CR=1 FL=1
MRFHASLPAFFALSGPVPAGPAQALERSDAPTRYPWDRKDLYVDEAGSGAGSTTSTSWEL